MKAVHFGQSGRPFTAGKYRVRKAPMGANSSAQGRQRTAAAWASPPSAADRALQAPGAALRATPSVQAQRRRHGLSSLRSAVTSFQTPGRWPPRPLPWPCGFSAPASAAPVRITASAFGTGCFPARRRPWSYRRGDSHLAAVPAGRSWLRRASSAAVVGMAAQTDQAASPAGLRHRCIAYHAVVAARRGVRSAA